MYIKVSPSLSIRLTEKERDEITPAMKFNIAVNINKPDYKAKITTCAWIDCDEFDDFINEIATEESACLMTRIEDDSSFELRLNPFSKELSWSCGQSDRNNLPVVIMGRENLPDALRYHILEVCFSHSRWWRTEEYHARWPTRWPALPAAI